MTAEPNLDLWEHGGPPEPSRLMHLVGEVFPFAADDTGIWLLSGEGPWVTYPIAEDSSPIAECEWELTTHGAVAVIGPHQSSSRVDGPAGIWTHFAVIECRGPVRATWRHALPVSPRLVDRVGKPPTHPANATPQEVRMVDAFHHALRHLAFQLSEWGDAEIADKLDVNWRRHLAAWRPTLYRLYDRVYESA